MPLRFLGSISLLVLESPELTGSVLVRATVLVEPDGSAAAFRAIDSAVAAAESLCRPVKDSISVAVDVVAPAGPGARSVPEVSQMTTPLYGKDFVPSRGC